MNDITWSTKYGCNVSRSWSDKDSSVKSKVKIDIAKCTILVTKFGFYKLYFKGRQIKTLSFKEYLRYKDYVIKIEYERGNTQ